MPFLDKYHDYNSQSTHVYKFGRDRDRICKNYLTSINMNISELKWQCKQNTCMFDWKNTWSYGNI